LSARAVLTATGATCSGTLTIGWNSKSSPATELDYAADPSLGGIPTPYGGVFSTASGATKVSTQVPFTLPSGQSTAYQVTAKNGGTTITSTTSNTVSCP
jgi:transcription elongation factor